MNIFRKKTSSNPFDYQRKRLQELINEIVKCCQERMVMEADKFGLHQAELKCILLFDGERYLTVKSLAERMNVAKSRITKIVDGLITKGLGQRIDDPKDNRVKLISLTSAGLNKCNNLRAFMNEAHEKVLMHMEPSERKILLSSLELLRSCMEIVKSQIM